jgi:hypothetical protein
MSWHVAYTEETIHADKSLMGKHFRKLDLEHRYCRIALRLLLGKLCMRRQCQMTNFGTVSSVSIQRIILLTHLCSYPLGWRYPFRFGETDTSLDKKVDFLFRQASATLLKFHRHMERVQQFVFLEYTC